MGTVLHNLLKSGYNVTITAQRTLISEKLIVTVKILGIGLDYGRTFTDYGAVSEAEDWLEQVANELGVM